MVPGRPAVLRLLGTPRRYADPAYMASIAPDLYGGKARSHPELAASFARASLSGGARGYYAQLSAADDAPPAGRREIDGVWRRSGES